MSNILKGKRVLITGGTGSLGGSILKKIMEDTENLPEKVRVFSRDESKQYLLKAEMEELYKERAERMEYIIGDVRNIKSLQDAALDIQIVIHAAALKHVPVCEKNTMEAVETNIIGAENLVQIAAHHARGIERVVALSTDKACAPFSLMGMTKAVQERIFAAAGFRTSAAFVCVRLGNILMSRGSIVPLFLEQISRGNAITLTDPKMARFFIDMEGAAEHVLTALNYAEAGQVYIPEMKAASILRLAQAIAEIHGSKADIKNIGARPGEKFYDILISKNETPYITECPQGGYLLNSQVKPQQNTNQGIPYRDYCSNDEEFQMTDEELTSLLEKAIFSGTTQQELCIP